ncbi:MAG: bifunctional phosphoribosylaminoimidazolecarboxamide formyltransferase/IMP cyclohydrolase [Candidatus Hodarchaeota archaeon]
MAVYKRALFSVSDKTDLVEFAKGLKRLIVNLQIISTGGTAKFLQSEVTKFPEILDGRVKTLHPLIHGGILGIRANEDHRQQMIANKIESIDFVVVNLYPFRKTILEPRSTLLDAIENIDIGGPTLIRASAKNYQDVVVVTNPSRYSPILEELRETGKISLLTRENLAVEAFAHTSQYDAMIYTYLQRMMGSKEPFPSIITRSFEKIDVNLRYGENPHQRASVYRDTSEKMPPNVAEAHIYQGKALSYVNILDFSAALEILFEFEEPTAVIIKHMNPCGIASADTITDAYIRARETDPKSAFGSIVGINRPLEDEVLVKKLTETFVEGIITPSVNTDFLPILGTKPNMRVLETGESEIDLFPTIFRPINGGLLVQDRDRFKLTSESFKIVTKRVPTSEEEKNLLFAWKVVKHIKSNAIILVKNQQACGIGAGQMSRVDSAIIARRKALENKFDLKNAVMASDAFFPFRDSTDTAAKAGISAIIQPGGSIRDQESIQAANEHNIAMVFTGVRCFKH